MPGSPRPVGSSAGRNGLAVASLVLGIISIPMCFLFIPGVLAVVFGIVALSQIGGNPGQAGRGQAIAGLVLGIISLLFIVLAVVFAGEASFDIESTLVMSILR